MIYQNITLDLLGFTERSDSVSMNLWNLYRGFKDLLLWNILFIVHFIIHEIHFVFYRGSFDIWNVGDPWKLRKRPDGAAKYWRPRSFYWCMFSFVLFALLLHLVSLTVTRASPPSVSAFIIHFHFIITSALIIWFLIWLVPYPFYYFSSIKGHVFVLWHLSVFLSTEVTVILFIPVYRSLCCT